MINAIQINFNVAFDLDFLNNFLINDQVESDFI